MNAHGADGSNAAGSKAAGSNVAGRPIARSLLAVASAALLVAGVAVGCSSDGATGPPPSTTAPVGDDAPVLTGAPDPASVPAPLWQASLSGPNPLANFRVTPYNNEGAAAPKLVDAPDVAGRKALEFTVPSGGKRSEVEPNTDVYQEGDEAWFGFAWFVPQDFPVGTEGFQVVAQWKNAGEGSPPVEVKIGGGQFLLDGGAGGENPQKNYFTMPIGPARTGAQTDIVVHLRFSTDPTKALIDVWMNGQQRIAGFRPPAGTRYESADSYVKTGLYRDTAIPEDARLDLVDARIAASYDSAAALVGPR